MGDDNKSRILVNRKISKFSGGSNTGQGCNIYNLIGREKVAFSFRTIRRDGGIKDISNALLGFDSFVGSQIINICFLRGEVIIC